MRSWQGWIWADGIFWGLGLQPRIQNAGRIDDVLQQQHDRVRYQILRDASDIADRRNGFIEADVIAQDGSERYW